MVGSIRTPTDTSSPTVLPEAKERDAPKIDWGYSVNRLMEAARRSVAKAEADPCKWELGELIKAKLLAADEGHKLGGIKGIGIVQDSRNEARALIAAAIERHLAEITDEQPDEHLTWTILETALAAEDLRMRDAVDDQFRHQLQLETMCHALTSAVLFLLCKQIAQPTQDAKARTEDEGTSDGRTDQKASE